MELSTKTDSLYRTESSGRGKTQRERILDLLHRTDRPWTRRELEEFFEQHRPRIRLSAVCGRVNELIQDGEVRVVGTRWDGETEREVETVAYVPPAPKQQRLF